MHFSLEVGSLKYDSYFHQEGLFGVNIVGFRLSFIKDDDPVKALIISNVFSHPLADADAQYPDEFEDGSGVKVVVSPKVANTNLRDEFEDGSGVKGFTYLTSGKDSAFVDQEDLDDEERVGYETDTYFFDPNDTSFEGDIDDEVQPEAGTEATLVTIPTKGEPNWLLRIELDNIILEHEATINKTKAIIAEAQVRMETAQEQMKELEIKSFELIMERALKASQLRAEEARLEVVKVQVIPTDLEVLKERALKGALDARDAELATHIEHIKSLSHQ
ncbi:uncharacterized protein A4U43_C08F15850 [Asparagus officinalis]|nr:uncharacterized protein A4U43_C08F15850 [Asparagus officinalis]